MSRGTPRIEVGMNDIEAQGNEVISSSAYLSAALKSLRKNEYPEEIIEILKALHACLDHVELHINDAIGQMNRIGNECALRVNSLSSPNLDRIEKIEKSMDGIISTLATIKSERKEIDDLRNSVKKKNDYRGEELEARISYLSQELESVKLRVMRMERLQTRGNPGIGSEVQKSVDGGKE